MIQDLKKHIFWWQKHRFLFDFPPPWLVFACSLWTGPARTCGPVLAAAPLRGVGAAGSLTQLSRDGMLKWGGAETGQVTVHAGAAPWDLKILCACGVRELRLGFNPAAAFNIPNVTSSIGSKWDRCQNLLNLSPQTGPSTGAPLKWVTDRAGSRCASTLKIKRN